MRGKRKTMLQIAVNLVVTMLLISVVLWKTPSGYKTGWDSSIVVLSMLVNIIIVYRARELRRSAEQQEHHV